MIKVILGFKKHVFLLLFVWLVVFFFTVKQKAAGYKCEHRNTAGTQIASCKKTTTRRPNRNLCFKIKRGKKT